MTINHSKRNFLRTGFGATVSTAALGMFPPSIRRALAIEANNATGTIMDVEHVVILMQENRSFDNYFGTLSGVRGFGDRFPIPLADGLNVWQQKDVNGALVLPYHLDQTEGNAQRVSGTPHSWVDARDAWDCGRMNQWPTYKQQQSMGYFTEQEAPFQYALANAFTICDAYFCSLHGGTNTNRLFHMTGTNGATTTDGKVVVNNVWDGLDSTTDLSTTGYNWKTYPERLEEAGVTWMVYQNMPGNYTDNPLAGFKQYRQANLDSGKPVYHDVDNNPAYDASTDDAIAPLYKGIANTMPDGGFLTAFRDDVLNNKLRQVTWIVAPSTYSEHPGPSSPAQGAWYTQEVLDALTANPDIWSKTVLLVNFDENDGFFDHVPPPCAPSMDATGAKAGKATLTDDELSYEYYTHAEVDNSNMPDADGDCYGPGPRVPMYVISPWSKGGWVNSQQFDHTSVLRFLEARFGIEETNISPYRRAVFGDLTSAFNFATPNAEFPALSGRTTKESADALISAQEALGAVPLPYPQSLPGQEQGERPSRALPYELHVSARADSAAATVQLIFSNTGKQAAVYHVYDRLHLDRIPRRYMVQPDMQLDDVWETNGDQGEYDLWVLGPNGFHRAFKGDLTAQAAQTSVAPEVRVCYDIANGNVYLTVMNDGNGDASFIIKANAYFNEGPWTVAVGAGASEDIHWDLTGSKRWYDFTVTCPALTGWSRRFAGRVETGEDGISDPAMGFEGF